MDEEILVEDDDDEEEEDVDAQAEKYFVANRVALFGKALMIQKSNINKKSKEEEVKEVKEVKKKRLHKRTDDETHRQQQKPPSIVRDGPRRS